MAQGQHFFILTTIAIVLLLIISKCHSYPVFGELPVVVGGRPMKVYSPQETNRYANRMKQYYETMAQLRHWRRDIPESNDVDDDELQDMLRQYDHLQYIR